MPQPCAVGQLHRLCCRGRKRRGLAWARPIGRGEPLAKALSNTIRLVEASHSHIPWMEPRDLDLDALARKTPGA